MVGLRVRLAAVVVFVVLTYLVYSSDRQPCIAHWQICYSIPYVHVRIYVLGCPGRVLSSGCS